MNIFDSVVEKPSMILSEENSIESSLPVIHSRTGSSSIIKVIIGIDLKIKSFP